jgi:hypothetical protein
VKLFVAALLLFCFSSFAETAVQTDWSGGPGVAGPVLSWGNSFSSDTGTNWYEPIGSVGLLASIQHPVDLGFIPATMAVPSDINGNGTMDIVGCSFDLADICWWQNINGSGTSWGEHFVFGYFYDVSAVTAGDLDGDGDEDIVAASVENEAITWWENGNGVGGDWSSHPVDAFFPGITSIALVDIDADGDLDVLAATEVWHQLCLWRNLDGLGLTWQQIPMEGHEFDHACWVTGADLDGDGDGDIIGAARWADDIAWWQNLDGAGTTWEYHLVDESFDGARCVQAVDLDGDSDLDLIGAAENANDVCWWENMDGSALIWTKHFVDDSFMKASVLSYADLDSDGDMDLIGGSRLEGPICWWENANGTGTSWIEHPVELEWIEPCFVSAADFDSDGECDVLGAGGSSGDIVWWKLGAYRGSGSLTSSILYIGGDGDWDSIQWTAQIPSGTALGLQLRSSDDPSSMGAWSDTLWAPTSLHGILSDNTSYAQYKVVLLSANADTAAALLDVTISWDPLGAGDDPLPMKYQLSHVIPNPCAGPVSIEFGLPLAEPVGLSVFDVTGRLIQTVETTEYQSGWHTIQLQPLSSGIYFVRMRAGEFTANQRFAVVD